MNIVKNTDGTYVITFTVVEKEVVNAMEVQYGPDVISILITDWIKSRTKFLKKQREETFSDDYQKLDSVKKKQVDDILKGTTL